jgi:excisionase family DNA binding protein
VSKNQPEIAYFWLTFYDLPSFTSAILAFMQENTRAVLLTIRELSQYLNIKRSTLYAWAAQGKIPHVKIHGVIRFQKEEIDAWVESFRKERLKKVPSPSFSGRDYKDIDTIIAKAKREVYNAHRGETRPISSPGKEGKDGAI